MRKDGVDGANTKTGLAFEEDLRRILDYLWKDEQKHFEESGCPKDHIFKSLERIKKILN